MSQGSAGSAEVSPCDGFEISYVAGRGTHGHPVMSIYQTDIIIYGTDLADYIDNDFSGSGRFISANWTPPPMVPFWSDFL